MTKRVNPIIRKTVTRYITDDGEEFRTPSGAVRHQALSNFEKCLKHISDKYDGGIDPHISTILTLIVREEEAFREYFETLDFLRGSR